MTEDDPQTYVIQVRQSDFWTLDAVVRALCQSYSGYRQALNQADKARECNELQRGLDPTKLANLFTDAVNFRPLRALDTLIADTETLLAKPTSAELRDYIADGDRT